MPLTRSSPAALELVARTYSDCFEDDLADALSEARIDMTRLADQQSLLPTGSLDKVLKQRADAMWMLPSTRQQAQAAIEQLEGVDWDIKALVSPRLLPPLLYLHQLKVLDLRECGNPLDRQNAIDHLIDAAPDLPLAEKWRWQVDLPQSLKALARAGISADGHPESNHPPLVRALCRADGDTWVAALLQAGADPLRRTFDDATPGAGKIACLGVAVRRGQDTAVSLMIDALLPAGEALGKKAFGALIKAAIEADCHALFCRLDADHGTRFPGMVARALIQHGRQIGPRLALHLAKTYAHHQAKLDLYHNLLRPVRAELPDDAEMESRLHGRNRAIIAALSRVMALDLPARAREIRAALHEASGNLDYRSALAEACEDALTALAPRASFDLAPFENTFQLFGHLWADREIEPSVAASAGRDVTDTLLGHADHARQTLHDALKAFWGESAYRSLVTPRPMWRRNQLESADDALLRSCRETRVVANKARQACEKLRAELALLKGDASNLTELNPYTGMIFNALLDTALEKSCFKTAKALLGETPQRNLRHGLGIADPEAVLIKIGTLAAQHRAELLPRVCQYIRQDSRSPLGAEALLARIEALLPNVTERDALMASAGVGVMSFSGLCGSLYWLISKASELGALNDYEAMQQDWRASNFTTKPAGLDALRASLTGQYRGRVWPDRDDLITQTRLAGGLAVASTALTGWMMAVQVLARQAAQRREAYREELLHHLSAVEV